MNTVNINGKIYDPTFPTTCSYVSIKFIFTFFILGTYLFAEYFIANKAIKQSQTTYTFSYIILLSLNVNGYYHNKTFYNRKGKDVQDCTPKGKISQRWNLIIRIS